MSPAFALEWRRRRLSGNLRGHRSSQRYVTLTIFPSQKTNCMCCAAVDVNRLLLAYGLPNNGSLVERRRRFKRHIGIVILT
jgi:hypothetical protein